MRCAAIVTAASGRTVSTSEPLLRRIASMRMAPPRTCVGSAPMILPASVPGPGSRPCETGGVRVERWFAFVDLAGFTSFGDEHGDDESVRVLTAFRAATRSVATDFGVRIAKWLGDGCMLVSVVPEQLVAAVCMLEQMVDEAELPLQIHAGMAGGAVILLEGDDYTGGCVNLASRLMDAAGPHEIFALPELAAHAPRRHAGRAGRDADRRGLPPAGRGRAARAADSRPFAVLADRPPLPSAPWKRSSSRATATSPGSA